MSCDCCDRTTSKSMGCKIICATCWSGFAMKRTMQAEIDRLRTVICTGGAMYRAERATMGIPGGFDPEQRAEATAGGAGEHYKQLWDDSCQAVKELCELAGAKPEDMPDVWTLRILIQELKQARTEVG